MIFSEIKTYQLILLRIFLDKQSVAVSIMLPGCRWQMWRFKARLRLV